MKQFFDTAQKEKFEKYFGIKKFSNNHEKKLFQKTYDFLPYISWIPWLLMVWVWNSLSMNCTNKNSDIDLFIVTKKNTLWLNRIIITIIFSVLWVKKTKNNHAQKFCLSFFATEKWMNFWKWSLENDIYLYFWILYLKPVLNNNNTYEKFLEKNFSWADFWEYKKIIEKNKKYIKISKNKKNPWKISKILDNLFKKIFINKTIKNYKKLWKPYWIIINNDLLKFHNNDRRKKIKKELED